MISVGDDNGEVKVFNYEDGSLIYLNSGHSSAVTRVSFSPDSKLLITGDSTGGIFIWRVKH